MAMVAQVGDLFMVTLHVAARDGYGCHAVMRAAWGAATPRPFRGLGAHDGRCLVRGVVRCTADALADIAETRAVGEIRQRVEVLAVEPLAMHACASVHAMPVVRRASDRRGQRRGAEVDAWQARREPTQDRRTCYVEWLRSATLRACGEAPVSADVTSWGGVEVVRRRQADDARLSLWRSELLGVVQLSSQEAMHRLVDRGIGRHRAFGFGLVDPQP